MRHYSAAFPSPVAAFLFTFFTVLGVVNSNAKDFSKKFSKCNM